MDGKQSLPDLADRELAALRKNKVARTLYDAARLAGIPPLRDLGREPPASPLAPPTVRPA
jgi:hypothetical protein